MRAGKYITVVMSMFCVANVCGQTPATTDAPAARHNPMPVPAAMRFKTGKLSINKSFNIAARGHIDARLQSADGRAMRRLEGRTLSERRATLADACEATRPLSGGSPSPLRGGR